MLTGCAGAAERGSSATSGSSAETAASRAKAGSSETTGSSKPASSAASTAKSKILVACFSATGNTRALAQELSEHLSAEYIEIEPAEPYTDEDLSYNDRSTRATVEQDDPTTRPSLAALPDFSAYDVVLLGHPIWWGKAPRLICTLLENSDLSGKKVAEFCTSGSSGVDGAHNELKELTPEVDWVGAKRFATGTPKEKLAEWADSLGIK